MAGYQDEISLTLKESMQCAGTWKVWVKQAHGSGWLRLGFAWRTKQGAIHAGETRYPGATWTS
mgnify:CR=1 FL=1